MSPRDFTVAAETWSCTRRAKRATSSSFDPKWWLGRPRLVPARSPILARDACSIPSSAINAAAASSNACSDLLLRSACVLGRVALRDII